MNVINRDNHKEIISKLDYEAPPCPNCRSKMKKYDFQKPSKIPYLETTGMATRILQDCPEANWKDFYDWHCPSAVYFNFNCHSQTQWLSLWAWFFSSAWDYVLGRWNSQGSDCFNRELKMSFIAQDFKKLNIITVLEGRTQAIIRNHFLRYNRAVRCQVKIITMDMFSPYYDLAKQLRFLISRLRLKQSPRLFHSQTLKSF